ncbi:hypothetical protein [Tsuneonella sp. HG222]
MNVCAHEGCETTLGRGNASGYCKRHYAKHCMTAEHAANIRAGQKRRMMDPEQRERLREQARAIGKLPQAVKARRERAIRDRIWEKGLAAVTPEGRKLAGARSRATKLAWCPPELRDDYMYLIRTKRIKAAEARTMILERHEAEMARWRRAIGAPSVVFDVSVESHILPSRGSLPERQVRSAAASQAKWERIETLRVNRTICPHCGARSDIGCEHSRRAA